MPRSGPPRLAVALCASVLLTGCTGHRATAPTTGPPSPGPRLGGPVSVRHPSPRRAMSRLERPIARMLSRQVAAAGLTVDYLDCPHWDRDLPSSMTCRGYVAGLLTRVRVDLHASTDGDGVAFHARLRDGLVATRTLEETLARQRWSDPDCGDGTAYPARTGSRIVCRVSRAGSDRYVVATVTDRTGGVRITAYRGPAAGG